MCKVKQYERFILLTKQAVKQELEKKDKFDAGTFERFSQQTRGQSHRQMKALALELGVQPFWDADVPRTREGYFHYQAGVEAAISRLSAFAPYADLLWLETKTPDLKQAQSFARKIREKHPSKWFVYNLSPSFNWSAHGFSGKSSDDELRAKAVDTDLKNFCWDLAKEGFVGCLLRRMANSP